MQQLRYWYPNDLSAPSSPDADAEQAIVVKTLDSCHALLHANALDGARSALLEPSLVLMRAASSVEQAVTASRLATALLSAHANAELTASLRRAESALERDEVPQLTLTLTLTLATRHHPYPNPNPNPRPR